MFQVNSNIESGRTYYYARVSTEEQNLQRQLDAFAEMGADERYIVTDKATGKNLDRIGFQNMKVNLLRAGDTLVVTELDRLGRDAVAVKEELEWFRKNGIRVMIKNIPTTMMTAESAATQGWLDMITNLLIEVLATMAEEELNFRKERQMGGINAMPTDEKGRKVSLKTGKVAGRPEAVKPAGWDEAIAKVEAGEMSATEAMQKLGLKRTTYYKLLKS